jgi:two-component system cell cycle sensor histidine kinase/response regulator CckA
MVEDDMARSRLERALRESEEKYRNLVERAADGVVIIQDGLAKYVNPRLAEMWGGRVEECTGRPFVDFVDPDAVPEVVDRYRRRVAGEAVPAIYETVLRRKDGAQVCAELSAGIITYDGKPADLVIVRDVTERKRVDAEIASERNLLRTLIDNMPDMIYAKDIEHRYVLANKAVAQFVGADTADALLGDDDSAFYPHGVAAHIHANERRVTESGQPMINHEEVLRTAHSDELRWFSATQVPLRDSAGTIVGLVGISRDITEHKHDDEAQQARLRRVQQQQEAIVRLATHETVLSGDLEAACRTVTEAMAGVMDVERCSVWMLSDDGMQLRCIDLYEKTPARHSSGHVLLADSYPMYFQAVGAGRAVDAYDVLTDPRTDELNESYSIPLGVASLLDAAIRVSGRLVGVVSHEHVGMRRRWEGDEVTFAGEVADQIAQAVLNRDRVRAEEALRASQRRLELALKGADLGMYDWDMRTDEIVINERYAEMLGYTADELLLTNIEAWKELIHPDDMQGEEDALNQERAGQFPLVETEYRMRTKDGGWKWILDRGKAVEWDAEGRATRFSGTHLDLTERKRAEEQRTRLQAQMVEAQKMKAIGQLAAGVAHDFNNLLTGINGFADLLSSQMAPDDPKRQMVDRILVSGKRAAELVSQLLAFGRKQMVVPRLLDLNVLVRRVELMLRHMIREDIELVTDLTDDLWQVRMDPAQVEQIVVNLSLNARDAMPDGGTMTIRTANVVLDDAYLATHPDVRAGAHVLLTIVDTGVGMTREVKERVFEPFFTTKEVGGGSGLGLPSVYGIVKQNGGDIALDSEPGKGTTISIYLPSVGSAEGSPDAPPAGNEAFPPGNETILLVEDHQAVLDLAQQILEERGYRVLTARNGREALELVALRSRPIDLLVTDVIMPGMTGRELAERLLSGFSDLRVLYMSGYADDVIEHRQVSRTGTAFLQKPFHPADLARKVRQILDS